MKFIFILKVFLAVYLSAFLSYGIDERDYKNLSQSVAIVYNKKGGIYGNGFFITKNLFVTNYHVIEELVDITNESTVRRSQYVEVITPRKIGDVERVDWIDRLLQYPPWLGMRDLGRVLVVDPKNDLAIIKTLRDDYKPLTLGSDRDIIRGERAFLMSYISPPEDPTQKTKRASLITDVLDFLNYRKERVLAEGFIGMRIGNKIFRTTTPSVEGKSGSPLFSKDFKVIGVLQGGISSVDSTNTFSIPIHKLKILIEENQEFLEREGEMRLEDMYPEPLRRRALDGDVKTAGDMFILSIIYKDGIASILPDSQKAWYWRKKAAEQGHREAQYDLAITYASGEDGAKKDSQKAWYWYKRAAEQGYKEAQYYLGGMYAYGEGVEKDSQKAFYWFQKAAQQGDRKAQHNLAVMYINGEGVKKDPQKAFHDFKRLANQGYKKAQYNLGIMYTNGEGVEKDPQKALEWFKVAAEQGDSQAQFKLGTLYYYGEIVRKNRQKARYWLKKAAKQGDRKAQESLGIISIDGKGFKKNFKKAHYWFQKAAEQGGRKAQHILGSMYINGEGVKKDAQKAFYWFQKAAEQGDRKAQRILATLYTNGEGVKKDAQKAKYWKEESQKTDHPECPF